MSTSAWDIWRWVESCQRHLFSSHSMHLLACQSSQGMMLRFEGGAHGESNPASRRPHHFGVVRSHHMRAIIL